MDINTIVRRAVLDNAVKHGGKANVGSVIGHVLGQQPELKQNIDELKAVVFKTVSEINLLNIGEQADELKDFGSCEKKKRAEKDRLPDIPELAGKKVVVRFAPNPDGAIHLGNARPAVLSDEFRKKYNGKLILRFDDTDPKVKSPEKRFYEWIKEDVKWLGIKWSSEVVASKRLKIYYSYADKLVKMGAAYVCVCNPEQWKELRNRGETCPCRGLGIDEQVRRWKKMLNANKINSKTCSQSLQISYNTNSKSLQDSHNTISKDLPSKSSHNKDRKTASQFIYFTEGQAVLRIKTDISHPNPAVRDWPAVRIVDNPNHPFSNARVWPLYNFASGIDDHLTGVNLILRGQEHATNDDKQKYLYGHLGWQHPKILILGRFLLPEFVLSKSLMRKGIEEGKFSGWDDPKLGTIRTMRRRGISSDAIRNLIVEIGVQTNDAVIDFDNLSAHNKKVIDKIANRYFFVQDPQKIRIKYKAVKAQLALHPDKKNKFRTLVAKDSVYLDKRDMSAFENKDVRLIGLYNIILRTSQSCPVIAIGEEAHVQAKERRMTKIHWLPVDKKQAVNIEILTIEGIVKGFCEKTVLKEKVGSVVQFERFGFVRLEKLGKNKVFGVFGHK